MTFTEQISALRESLRSYVDQSIMRVFIWTLTAKSSPLGDGDRISTSDDSGAQRPARRIQPFGLISRAPAKMRSLCIRLGASNVFFLGVASNGGYGPTDLADGETALYCSADGAIVKLDKDGNISVSAGSGKTIKVATSGNVELGPDGGPNAAVLIFGSMDSMGVPVTQAPAFTATKVKAG